MYKVEVDRLQTVRQGGSHHTLYVTSDNFKKGSWSKRAQPEYELATYRVGFQAILYRSPQQGPIKAGLYLKFVG